MSALMALEKGMWPLREEKEKWKCKFAKTVKYKYVTGGLAFLIKGGLIYGRPYVSRVLKQILQMLVKEENYHSHCWLGGGGPSTRTLAHP